MLSAAYLGVPSLGGLGTFFTNLRSGLEGHGIELSWLGSGKREHALAQAEGVAGSAADGLVVAPQIDREAGRAQALLDYVSDRQIRVVLLNVITDPVSMGLAFHLPHEVRRILIVHSISPMTYRVAGALRDHVHAVVAPSPRIQSDLVRWHGFDPDWTVLIPHGLRFAASQGQDRPDHRGGPLRVLFLGRVEDGAKGVLWLPKILEKALGDGADVRLTIGGDGPDLAALRAAIARRRLASHVVFLGKVPLGDAAALAAKHDVFLMPSRFEGLPFSLLEAMACGCVPVASRLRGVTDFVIQQDRTGLLFPVGSARSAAQQIVRLHAQRELLATLSAAARQDTRARFDGAEQAGRYAQLIRTVLDAPRPVADPSPGARWNTVRGFRPGWWHRLPRPVKNALRELRERVPFPWRSV